MEEKGDKKSFQGLSLDEYRREYGFFGEINVLLERLKIEDLFFLDKLDPSDTDALQMSSTFLHEGVRTETWTRYPSLPVKPTA